ncbi:M20/M25/M40 family metallo-hydrolase [Hymenobacter tibetensis]|uniref:M20/M25/M40 family metallo-hydrolase n=1 Tax=Hymenobacter tibetensis TaxID=497967 RepID=A0ABY4D2B7_9BACT|nr:M20/M25/M40 family metallo-hydrolase [Hymenobacter tibetensis]UOG76684.1 M20/M25/M40 family metallo-hydrolase [Hymenobacter tibetensis]
MRNLSVLCFLSLLFSLPLDAQAQKKRAPVAAAKPSVSAATVERVIQTLAADGMQGRSSVKPGGLQAAQFLSTEFQRLGLQMLPGLSSYEQVFPAYESQVAALFVTINNAPVAKENALLISSQAHLNWTSEDEAAARVLVIGPQEKPQQHMRAMLRPTENTVVLLDPTHAADFKRLAEYVSHSTIRADKTGNPFSSIVLLAPAPNAPKVTFKVAGNTTTRTLELRNVVGVLPGKDPARTAEQVVFSAHYDHIGVLPPVAGDSIANGADDDASGTTAVVALAEYFKKKNDNARTLVFVAFTAEEIGGFGSQHFSKQLDPVKVVAMFNIEMIGKPAKFGPNTAFITGFERSDFGPLLQANLKGTPFRFEPDPYPEQNLFFRSDNATLARLGVPAHSISTDQIPTDKLYHSVDDEVESLDLANMTAVITAIARSATGIVAGQQTPTRITLETPAKP